MLKSLLQYLVKPKSITVMVIGLVLLPVFLDLLYGHHNMVMAADAKQSVLWLGFWPVDTLLIYTSFSVATIVVAVLTSLLAFTHHFIERDITTPIIGFAFLFSAMLMSAQLVTAIGLMPVADISIATIMSQEWLSQGYYAMLLALCIIASVIFKKPLESGKRYIVPIIFGIFFAVTAGLILSGYSHYTLDCMIGEVTEGGRDCHIYPLALFVLISMLLIRFYHKEHNTVSHALMISLFPAVMMEAYMVFGSKQVFDAYHMHSLWLNLLMYFIPFAGLLLDYIAAHRSVRVVMNAHIKAKDELKKYAKELEQSNQDLNDFAHIVSHDLKEPIRGIHNYTSFIIKDFGVDMDDRAITMLGTVLRLTRRMEGLLDALLEYSSVGRTHLAIKETSISQVVEEVLDSLESMLKDNAVEIRIPNPLPMVLCDSIRIGEVFRNLITNAVKYNDKADKWVEIGCYKGSKAANNTVRERLGNDFTSHIFYVSDNGIGVHAKHYQNIFHIFRRLHGHDQFGGGSGSGLTIIRKIIERHGGIIWLESKEEVGTTFYFTLEEANTQGNRLQSDSQPAKSHHIKHYSKSDVAVTALGKNNGSSKEEVTYE